jgi:ferritin-like metal-binding protein YciE
MIMGLFSKDLRTLDDLFVHQLRDIYYAEKQIVQSLPQMIEKATDSNLKRDFETHLGETKNHVNRLEQVFKMHGVEAKGIDCLGNGPRCIDSGCTSGAVRQSFTNQF